MSQESDTGATALAEITVTGSRRPQTVEEVPYNLSAISGDQLLAAGVTDLGSFTQQVPGLSIYDFGARYAAATVPVIRGLSADGAPGTVAFRTFEQSPVGLYFGNSPITGYFDLSDIQRVEVLRGPQGTLYGAGALGGAVRIIPNSPELGTTSGRIELSGGDVAHADSPSYGVDAVANLPVGETLAFRVSTKYRNDPGFVDVAGLLVKNHPGVNGVPILANPADPVNSRGVYYSQSDWNPQQTVTARASLLWKPNSQFNTELAYVYADVHGNSGPVDNPNFAGGPYPVDPRITLPPGRDYKNFSPSEEPFTRTSDLVSLDASYDAGFATVSSTSSYYKTHGSLDLDVTYGLAGYPFVSIISYYSGSPESPRFTYPRDFIDHEQTFTEELRIVSNSGQHAVFDYVAGLFFEKQDRFGQTDQYSPGGAAYSRAEGCTARYFYGASFPDCLLVAGTDQPDFTQTDSQDFKDKSIFGEFTWHFTARGQLTVGARHSWQDFTDGQTYDTIPFNTDLPSSPLSTSTSNTVGKVDPSFEYADHQFVYATWSQGFRRGGANSVPLAGPFADSPLLHSYVPDKVNNYEAGLKGRFANGLSYAVDAFDIEWDKPQIFVVTPVGNLAVINAPKARSRGMEFETAGPLLISNLTYNVSFAYADAKLTEGYSFAANNGGGKILPNEITGKAGEQLPGSPKTSAAATVSYLFSPVVSYEVTLSANVTYRGAVPLQLQSGATSSSGYTVGNLSAATSHGHWRLTAYVMNLADRRVVLSPAGVLPANSLHELANTDVINRPRQAGLRLAYSF